MKKISKENIINKAHHRSDIHYKNCKFVDLDRYYENYYNCIFEDCTFKNCNFERTRFHDCKFINCKIPYTQFNVSYMTCCVFDFNLSQIKYHYKRKLNAHYDTNKVNVLAIRIHQGKIDGNRYYHYGCGCILGTLEEEEITKSYNLQINAEEVLTKLGYTLNPKGLVERFAMNIMVGDTPDTNYFSEQLLLWTKEVINERER